MKLFSLNTDELVESNYSSVYTILDVGEARYWVEAELPIPETRTVESSGVLKMEEPDGR